MPRKKLEWSSDQIRTFKELCAIFCSKDEICQVMACTPEQLEKLVNKHLRIDVCGKATQKITFDEAFEKFSADGKISLRRKQKELALEGDRSMLVWLGKQYLGQSDPDKGKPQKVQVERSATPPAQVSIHNFRKQSPIAKAAVM